MTSKPSSAKDMSMQPEAFEQMRQRLEKNGGSVGQSVGRVPSIVLRHLNGSDIAPSQIAKPRLNKTESAFWEILKRREFKKVQPMALRLELASRCTYTPDFYCLGVGGEITFYETKGPFMREDGWIKLKMAARLYPEFQFVLAQLSKGTWTETVIKS